MQGRGDRLTTDGKSGDLAIHIYIYIQDEAIVVRIIGQRGAATLVSCDHFRWVRKSGKLVSDVCDCSIE